MTLKHFPFTKLGAVTQTDFICLKRISFLVFLLDARGLHVKMPGLPGAVQLMWQEKGKQAQVLGLLEEKYRLCLHPWAALH